MCRWLMYSGHPILLDTLLFKPKHSLIDQSMLSRSKEAATNGDGFGIGWYRGRIAEPGLFRSIRPAWNDFNLRDLAQHIEAGKFLAHVRATSLATVQETNCHPFRYQNWLFVHNGEVENIEAIRWKLVTRLKSELFPQILGTTDSETMFYLAITLGLLDDPIEGLARMVGVLEQWSRVWMTIGLSDGKSLWAVRYATDRNAPTLYINKDLEDIKTVLHDDSWLRSDTHVIVSEPVGEPVKNWKKIRKNSYLHVADGKVAVGHFVPQKSNGSSSGKRE